MSTTNFCPNCGHALPQSTQSWINCPSCNAPLPQPSATVIVNNSNNTNVPMRPVRRSNGIGAAGLTLSILSFFLGWIPVIGPVMWFLGLLFSFIGLFKSPRGGAIAGMIISCIGVVMAMCLASILGVAFAGLF